VKWAVTLRQTQRFGAILQRRMLTAVALCVLAICASPRIGSSAEVECLGKYDGHSIAPEYLLKFWPSGFRPSPGMCEEAFLHGPIEKGDYEKFLALLRPNYRYLNKVELDSPGGDVNEAIKIGKLIRKYLLTADAPEGHSPDLEFQPYLRGNSDLLCRGPDCVCASACALIWFGATTRMGVVGLHRPHTDDPEFKNAAPPVAANLYRRMISEVMHYLNEMEAPHWVNDTLADTSSDEIKWINNNLSSLDRSLDHPPSYAEWVNASCGRMTDAEYATMLKLAAKGDNRDANETMLHDLLSKKDWEINRCALFLRYSHVDQLAPP
jgi:hypothetical protein